MGANRIPDAVRGRLVDLAVAEPELSSRELAVRFTDQERYFVSEASEAPRAGALPSLAGKTGEGLSQPLLTLPPSPGIRWPESGF